MVIWHIDNNIHLVLFSLMVYYIYDHELINYVWKFAIKNNPLYGVPRLDAAFLSRGDTTWMHVLSQVLYLYEAEKEPKK